MTTKKSVTAKDKSAKAFENLPELNIEKQRIKDSSKSVTKLNNDLKKILKDIIKLCKHWKQAEFDIKKIRFNS